VSGTPSLVRGIALEASPGVDTPFFEFLCKLIRCPLHFIGLRFPVVPLLDVLRLQFLLLVQLRLQFLNLDHALAQLCNLGRHFTLVPLLESFDMGLHFVQLCGFPGPECPLGLPVLSLAF
jgi:hypothetical protein